MAQAAVLTGFSCNVQEEGNLDKRAFLVLTFPGQCTQEPHLALHFLLAVELVRLTRAVLKLYSRVHQTSTSAFKI